MCLDYFIPSPMSASEKDDELERDRLRPLSARRDRDSVTRQTSAKEK
jgi:hypothetical protein